MRSTLDRKANLRRYSVHEIDEMRRHLYSIEYANQRWPVCEPGTVYWGSIPDYKAEEDARSRRVEDQLRTYMMGGIDPEDLSDKAEKAMADSNAFHEKLRRDAEERLLKKEYGPR